MGRQSQAAGKVLETMLDRMHEAYAEQGLAAVDWTPPRFEIVSMGKGGRFVGQMKRKGPCDIKATLPGGLVAVADAKNCEGREWYLSELQPHQAARLDLERDLGAFPFVLLRLDGLLWVLPWVDRVEVEGRVVPGLRGAWWLAHDAERQDLSLRPHEKRLDRKDVETIGIRCSDGGWLPVVRGLINERRAA